MRKILLVVLLVSLSGFVFAESNGLEIINLSFNRNGTNLDFAQHMDEDFNLILSCVEEIGKVDIIFVLDTTSSMTSAIASVKNNVNEFVRIMTIAGFDARFGIITFGDYPNIPCGTELKRDTLFLQACLAGIGTHGGADAPETALDAMMWARDSMEWRMGARRVILLVTDAGFCQKGIVCPDCHSEYDILDVEIAMVKDAIMCFIVTKPSPAYHTCTGFETSNEIYRWYGKLTSITADRPVYHLGTGFAAIFAGIIGAMPTYETIQVRIMNNTGATIDTMSGFIQAGWGLTLMGDTTIIQTEIEDGEIVEFIYRIDYSGIPGGPSAFKILFKWGLTDSLILGGRFDQEECVCVPPEGENLWPRENIWSACGSQELRIRLWDTDWGVWPNTIVFDVNGNIIQFPDPRLTFSDSVVSYTPFPGEFRSGNRIDYAVVYVTDSSGCPLQEPIANTFRMDLVPPTYRDYHPYNREVIGSQPDEVSVKVTDILSGVDPSLLFFVVNKTDTLRNNISPDVRFSDGVLTLTLVERYHFTVGDTVEVCVYGGDNVSEDYCGPNTSSSCWSFFIDCLLLAFKDTIVAPASELLLPMYCSDPRRFSVTDFEFEIGFNKNIMEIEDIITSYTATTGSDITWEIRGDDVLYIEGSRSIPLQRSNIFFKIKANILDVPGASYSTMHYITAILNEGYGKVCPTDGMVMVKFRPHRWIHPMTFTGVTATGLQKPSIIAIGCADGASEGYDPELDIRFIHVPDETYVYSFIDDPVFPSIIELQRDMHNTFDLPSSWIITTHNYPGTIRWNPRNLPDGLFRLNNVLDMKQDSVYNYIADEIIEITYLQPLPVHEFFTYSSGWNLIGLPVIMNMPDWTGLIPDIFAGPMEYDTKTKSFFFNELPREGHGFWIYTTEEYEAHVAGIPKDETSILVYRGWNLIGTLRTPSHIETEPAGILVESTLYYWDALTHTYISGDIDDIIPGKGYWVLCTNDGILTLKH